MKHRTLLAYSVVIGILALGLTSSASASLVLGQIDDFENGTLMNWGGGASRSNQLGGPGGAGDRYLSVTSSGGGGPGSRLATFNDFQWAGDYISAGITGLTMDLKNFSDQELHMRLFLLFGSGGEFTSTNAIILAPNSDWQSVYFGLTASDMTAVDGGVDLDLSLSNLPRLMIRHQDGEPGGIGSPPSIAATLGIDNIMAVPEPSTLGLLGIGVLVLIRRRR